MPIELCAKRLKTLFSLYNLPRSKQPDFYLNSSSAAKADKYLLQLTVWSKKYNKHYLTIIRKQKNILFPNTSTPPAVMCDMQLISEYLNPQKNTG